MAHSDTETAKAVAAVIRQIDKHNSLENVVQIENS